MISKYDEFTEQQIKGFIGRAGERNIKVGETYVMVNPHKPNKVSEFQPDTLVVDGIAYEVTRVQITSIGERPEYLYVGYKPFGNRFTDMSFGYARFYPHEGDSQWSVAFIKAVEFNELRKAIHQTRYAINSWLHNEAFTDDSYVHDYITLFDDMGEKVNLQVNWSAIGSVSPEKAEAFGKALVMASEACKNFKYNGYEITYRS